MSFYPEYRYCFKCGRRYPYNPDAGQLCCPNCVGSGIRALIQRMKKSKP